MTTRRAGSVRNKRLVPLRWRELDGRILATNDAGDHAWLDRGEFDDLMAGRLAPGKRASRELARKGMIRGKDTEAELAARVRERSHHVFTGPGLHILILTLRCNHGCIYCHASRQPSGRAGYDMSLETAARVLDVIFQSPSPDLTIEFQGGEPGMNFDVLRWVVEEARCRNASGERNLWFSLVSNLTTLDASQLDFLVDNGVMVCTSIDGPAALHDHNRRLTGGHSLTRTLRTMKAFAAAYRKRKLDPGLAYVNALVTVSRSSLSQPKAIVDQYVKLGQKVIHLRPLNPFGMGKRIWQREGYTADEFLRFYLEALDYIIELNRQGVEMMEKMASLMLTRILTDKDPNYADLRSPCGAGIGQLAYNYDGRVYTCDEGRMVGAMGDDLFCIGDVHKNSYAEIAAHPGVQSLCVASCLECLPGCADCAYAPYCGVCPVYNYVEQGDLVARCPGNDRCRIQMGMFDHLFRRLSEPGMEELLLRWTESRDRSSVYQGRNVEVPGAAPRGKSRTVRRRSAKR
ncbi:MAG: His-Xaa-Ser system radical SAM maturase HxsB [Deltaproteobacteria bacterium]|nr:His-Xaa-Ser system radical SAM maturase HxsB [Deltaproteobacteria bacterium]